MHKKIIVSDGAPRAIGPYSLGVKAGGLVFFSGQIPLDPASGEMVTGDIAAQAERVMENIAGALSGAGLTFENVVKTTIFMTDLASFGVVNEIYGKRFTGAPPARSTVEVKGLPRGADVEIEVVAFCGE